MAGKREKPEDIVLKLRQVEVLQGQGKSVQEAVRQIGVTVQTYYRWRKEYGGMSRDQLKRLKELEAENTRLRRAVSDLTLDKMILAEAARDEGRQGNHPADGFQPRTRSPSKPFPPQAVHRPCAANPQRIGAQGLPHIGSASLDAAQGALWSAGRSPADRGHHRVGRRVWALWISHDHWAAEQQWLACKSQAR
jgi:putative transposase